MQRVVVGQLAVRVAQISTQGVRRNRQPGSGKARGGPVPVPATLTGQDGESPIEQVEAGHPTVS